MTVGRDGRAGRPSGGWCSPADWTAPTACTLHRAPPGRRTLQVTAAVLAGGFDIRLDDEVGLAAAIDGARAITAELGVPLVAMRTNWQAVADPDWEMTFAPRAAAVLHPLRRPRWQRAALGHHLRLDDPVGQQPHHHPAAHERPDAEANPAPTPPGRRRPPWRICPRSASTCGSAGVRTSQVATAAGARSACAPRSTCWRRGAAPSPALGPRAGGAARPRHPVAGRAELFEQLLGERDRLPDDVVADVRWLLEQPLVPVAPAPDQRDR